MLYNLKMMILAILFLLREVSIILIAIIVIILMIPIGMFNSGVAEESINFSQTSGLKYKENKK